MNNMFVLTHTNLMKKNKTNSVNKKVKKMILAYRKTDSPLGSYCGNSDNGKPEQDSDDL